MKYESFEVIMEDALTHDRVNLSFGRSTTVHDILEVLRETHEDMNQAGSKITGIKSMALLQSDNRETYREMRRNFINHI